MRILGLDTSGKTASVAILDTEKKILLGEHTIYTNRTHSQVIMPMCKQLLQDCNLTLEEIDMLSVSVGPGSYTGLRIGIAAVQGMAMVKKMPCAGVSTLEAMACRILNFPAVLSVMHARQNLFYAALFRTETACERIFPDELLSVEEIAERIQQEKTVLVTGEGAEEFLRQYPEKFLRLAPEHLRLQSAAGVCLCAASYPELKNSAAALTASYLQAVQIQKKKTEK